MKPDTCGRCDRVGGLTEVFRYDLDVSGERAEYVCVECLTDDERERLRSRLERCRTRLLESMFDTVQGKRSVVLHDAVQ